MKNRCFTASVLFLIITAATLAQPPRIGPKERSSQAGRAESPDPQQLPEAQPRNTLQTIESTWTGRHWVDAEIDPAKSPEQSRSCFQLEPGVKIELVAAEPLVVDPVAIAFDHRGQMFVVEYRDYPTGPPAADDPPLSRIVKLVDTDGDGRMDVRHVFAERLKFTHSLMAYNGGILAPAQTEIVFLQDTDGDHQADVRQVLFDGFQPNHAQMQIGNPRWGLDNWITLNYGLGKIRRIGSEGKPASEVREIPRVDFRFQPLTMRFGADSGAGQFGNTVDRRGHRFFCWNRNPIMVSMLSADDVQRNPFMIVPKAYVDVAPSGGDTRVFPLIDMKSNRLSHAGTHTSACGVTAYLGDLFGDDYRDSVFVCEPVGHLVTRSVVQPDGVGLSATRARPRAEFLASTDMWFRPASLANGPDGALYLADMYRLYVEHPRFFPADIVQRLDWRAGDDRGRIWRITPDGTIPRKFTPPETIDDLVSLVGSPNGWRRYLAQRLLVERQATVAAEQIRTLLRDRRAFGPLTRLHALWTLDGLGELAPRDIHTALADPDVYVRRDAVKLAARRMNQDPQLTERLLELADDDQVVIRYQVALAMGATDDERALPLLTQLAIRDGSDRWFSLAVQSSARRRSAAIMIGLLDSDKLSRLEAPQIDLVRELAAIVGARGNERELGTVLQRVGQAIPDQETASGAQGSGQKTDLRWHIAALSGLASGLARHQGQLGKTSLKKLIHEPTETLRAPAGRVRTLLEQIHSLALDQNRSTGERVAAVQLLAYEPFQRTLDTFERLLASDQPVEVHLAAIEAMDGPDPRAADIIVQRWPTLGPTARGPALEVLFRRVASARQTLLAMSSGKMSSSGVSLERRARLLQHPNTEIRSLATRVFGVAVSANRRKVVSQFLPALKKQGSPHAGARVFQRICANCHRIDGQGHQVGPDISDVSNRSREVLLHDILDPNRGVNPQYTAYTVQTIDGRVLSGLMTGETADALVLLQSEGKQQIVPRSEIEVLRASGQSLMPEGVEKDVDLQQMADLLEFLTARNRPKLDPAQTSASGAAARSRVPK